MSNPDGEQNRLLRRWEEGIVPSHPMEWAKPEYSRSQVDKAGEYITNIGNISVHNTQYGESISIINNWRSAHSYPLNNFQINLRQRARKIDQSVLVSQRLKRFESIQSKLVRSQTRTMELSQMQDIAGCRAVMSKVPDVYRLVRAYQRGTSKKWLHTLVGNGKDYISQPKPDGYRSIHLIFRYVGTPSSRSWDKLRVEMQIRSQYQHAWATALEAVDIFTKQALKANQGDANWQRFFALMSSVIAIKEGTPLVPGTPHDHQELRTELASIAEGIGAVEKLQHFRHAIREVQGTASTGKSAYYLLQLSFSEYKIRWDTFNWNESQQANQQYTELERANVDNKNEHIVLVRAVSLAAMKKAYPSYFLDTKLFLDLVLSALNPLVPLG